MAGKRRLTGNLEERAGPCERAGKGGTEEAKNCVIFITTGVAGEDYDVEPNGPGSANDR